MIYALIFAGGVGKRMNSKSLPKQFLIVHGKPIIAHTIEHFQSHPLIDKIVVVCVSGYLDKMEKIADYYHFSKIISVVRGGQTGQDSIFRGLREIKKTSSKDDIVLIHDGVRPLIDEKTITDNIECAHKNRNAITISKSVETILIIDNDGMVKQVEDRSFCDLGRAPQTFYVDDIYESHIKARLANKHDFIDSAMLMQFYGYKMHTIVGPNENIKITTPIDFFLFKAILDAKENQQLGVL